MERIFEKIFNDSNGNSKSNINTSSFVAMSNEKTRGSKGSIGFDFIFDNKGFYKYTTRHHGFGKSINLRGKITVPGDGTYSVDIRSSDGGGGKWDRVKVNQELSCVINTSFWHETTVTVYISSNKPNCNGHAVIDYYI